MSDTRVLSFTEFLTLWPQERDALVAERVMGLIPWPGKPGFFHAPIIVFGEEPKPCWPPPYTSEIEFAWLVEEKIIERDKAENPLHLKHAYIKALNTLFTWSEEWPIRTDELFARVHAKPIERCFAALVAVGAVSIEVEDVAS